MSTPTHPVSSSDRFWAGAAHWSALVAAFVALAFLGPLVVMLTVGQTSSWVRRQAVESLNFTLSVYLYGIVLAVVGGILTLLTAGLALLVVIPLGLLLAAAWVVLVIVAASRAAGGDDFRYPLTLRVIG